MNKNQEIQYNQLRKIAQTGDPLLFCGKGLLSGLIKLGTGSEASHIAMIVKDVAHDIIYVMESTTISSIKGSRNGVQISLLSERLKSYKYPIYYRPLEGIVRDNKFDETFIKFREEMKDKEYEKNLFELIASAIDFEWLNNLINKEDLSTVFCSELIAEFYQRIGALDDLTQSNEYTPADFYTEKDGCDNSISLDWKTINGDKCRLGPQKLIIGY